MHRGLMGGNTALGGNIAVGGAGNSQGWGESTGGGGSGVGGVSTSMNHPSHHKYKSPKQFELK